MQAEVYDRLELPTAAPTGHRSGREKVPNLQLAYHPVLKRILFLAEKGLTSMMELFDFLSKRIAPLQHRARPTWMHTEENDTTQLECGHGSDLELKVLARMLSKVSVDPSSGDFINHGSSFKIENSSSICALNLEYQCRHDYANFSTTWEFLPFLCTIH
jgi:hypothetical protein